MILGTGKFIFIYWNDKFYLSIVSSVLYQFNKDPRFTDKDFWLTVDRFFKR